MSAGLPPNRPKPPGGRGAKFDALFEKLQATDAEVIQEPTNQHWGGRDCAFRDPSGNTIRIDEVK